MTRYMVDGSVLSPEEDARHKGACNAILNALADDPREQGDGSDLQEGCRESLVHEAFEIADEVVRESRRRIERACRIPEPPPGQPYGLASDEVVIARWVEGDFELTIPRNLAIGTLRELTLPMTLKEIAEAAKLRNDVVRDLVAAKVLLPSDDDGEPNAPKGGKETKL